MAVVMSISSTPSQRVAVLSEPVQSTPHQPRSEEHTSELQSRQYLVCRRLLEKKTIAGSHLASARLPKCWSGRAAQIEGCLVSAAPGTAPLPGVADISASGQHEANNPPPARPA